MKTSLITILLLLTTAGTAFACVQPTEEPTPTLEVTVTPTEASVTPIASESATPIVTPTETLKNESQSDGQHQAPDGLGCAVHECKAIMPSGAPMTGRAK